MEEDAKNTSRKWRVRSHSPPDWPLFVCNYDFAHPLSPCCCEFAWELGLSQHCEPSGRGTARPVLSDFAGGTWRKFLFSLHHQFSSVGTVPVLVCRALPRELSETRTRSLSPRPSGSSGSSFTTSQQCDYACHLISQYLPCLKCKTGLRVILSFQRCENEVS